MWPSHFQLLPLLSPRQVGGKAGAKNSHPMLHLKNVLPLSIHSDAHRPPDKKKKMLRLKDVCDLIFWI